MSHYIIMVVRLVKDIRNIYIRNIRNINTTAVERTYYFVSGNRKRAREQYGM